MSTTFFMNSPMYCMFPTQVHINGDFSFLAEAHPFALQSKLWHFRFGRLCPVKLRFDRFTLCSIPGWLYTACQHTHTKPPVLKPDVEPYP